MPKVQLEHLTPTEQQAVLEFVHLLQERFTDGDCLLPRLDAFPLSAGMVEENALLGISRSDTVSVPSILRMLLVQTMFQRNRLVESYQSISSLAEVSQYVAQAIVGGCQVVTMLPCCGMVTHESFQAVDCLTVCILCFDAIS